MKIGNLEYKVEYVKEHISETWYGKVNHQYQTISLAEGLSKERQQEVFLHEVLHCIFETTGVHPEDEEEIVTRLAKGLSPLLSDKQFVKHFNKENK